MDDVIPDMEKGADARTLSAEIFQNCGSFKIVEDHSPIFSEKNNTYCGIIWLNMEYLDQIDTRNDHFHNNSGSSAGF